MKTNGSAGKAARLTVLFTVTYMVSYMTRINFGAIVAEMESATQISRSLLSMALTGSFAAYGAGQIVSGVCGDRFSPKKLVSCGLAVTVLMNVLLPLCRSPWQMLAVWCVNGFAQAFLWPPLVVLMATLLSEDDYQKAVVKVSWGSSLGTIAVYLTAPLLISALGWKWVFRFSALCGAVMLAVWNGHACEIERRTVRAARAKGAGRALFTPLMFAVMAAIVLMGMLRDGVTTWMPSYISEVYHLENVISILTGVVLPVFGILCFQAASGLYRKVLPNPVLCAGAIFGVGAASALALFLLSGQNAACSVLFSALLTGCMHGVNLILVGMIPSYFKKYGNVSTVSGVLNSCTYIGSALSTYGVAVLSENLGWQVTLLIWTLVALAGTAVCFAAAAPWGRRFGGETGKPGR